MSFVLVIVVFSILTESVGAPAFFDDKITLMWKSDPALRTLLHEKEAYDSPWVRVLIIFSAIPTANDIALLSSLCRLRTFTGHVASVYSLFTMLPKLASLPFVTRIAMPRILKPELDISVPEILANQVWNTTEYPGVHDSAGRTVDGTGVIIGVADSGIDYLHKDFDFANGTSKILFIWDQTTPGNAPLGYDYGTECNPTSIASHSCPEFDGGGSQITGHGTAVAAVAASTGQASHNYYGVAPGASIIAVKLLGTSEDYVIDATSYMISKAHELGRPIAIVHSLGDSLGSHDGTEPLELAFTDFAEQGVPIVVSSGDEQTLNIHVSGTLSPGQSVIVPWSMSATNNLIDLWYPTSDIFGISITTPSGGIVTGQTPEFGDTTPDGNVIALPDMRPSGREWWINVTTSGSETPSGEWLFTLTSLSGAGGKWDAWTEPGQFIHRNPSPGTADYAIDKSDTIDAPGTAAGVITVGGYITKYVWLARCTSCIQWNKENDLQGLWSVNPGWLFPLAPGYSCVWKYSSSNPGSKSNPCVKPGWLGPTGALFAGNAGGSGIGPTRDGRIKPEIVAPAGDIAAARASTDPQVCNPFPGSCSDPDDYHTMWAGTSFAAPHVAGVIALMLQMNSYLSPNEIKTILEQNGREDSFTGTINKAKGSPIWGWGKVNALKSTLDTAEFYSVRLEVNSIGMPLSAVLAVDGTKVESIPLNQTSTVILEFTRGHTHTTELTPIVDVEPGIRYMLPEDQRIWNFSSGGMRTYTYQEQFYLQVNSQYGFPNGTGWYDANASAVVSISPTTFDGHQFQGWIGPVVSDSPTVTVRMDSSKELSATWSQVLPPTNQSYDTTSLVLVGVLILIGVVSVGLFMRYRSRRGKVRLRLSAD